MAAWQFSYYSAKVAATIDAWPPGILAGFQRIARAMLEHGPDLGLPHTRAMGGGLFEIRAKGREGIGRAFYCTATGPAHRDPARVHQENRTNTAA